MSAAPEVPAENRKPRQRLFRDDPQLIGQRGKDDRDVVDALVIGNEDVGTAGLNPFEALDTDPNARRSQNQPRPRTRASMREMAASVEGARRNRCRAEQDGVDGNRGNQEENGPPPVIRRDAQTAKYKVGGSSGLLRL